MADQTESSVVIDSAPENVLRVISDFEHYPTWAAAVKEAVVLERQPDGDRATKVRFTLDAGRSGTPTPWTTPGTSPRTGPVSCPGPWTSRR